MSLICRLIVVWRQSFSAVDEATTDATLEVLPHAPPQRKPTRLNVAADYTAAADSGPDPASAGKLLDPTHLSLLEYGSRFLPHSKDPIKCALPLPSLKLILIGTTSGLSVLDVEPALHGSQATSAPNVAAINTPVDAVSMPIWTGEAVYQLDLLEDTPGSDGMPCGVVVALVARPENEQHKTIRLYNLGSLANLAKWYSTHKVLALPYHGIGVDHY